MKKPILIIAILLTFGVATGRGQKPATVIITAGQSNTDGRVLNIELPSYIKDKKYEFCKWNFGGEGRNITGKFETFWPTIVNQNRPGRWAYDAITYYYLEQALKEEFYVIKWSLGGTAIDTNCTSTSRKYWNADKNWLSRNHSTATGGRSLLLSFTESIAACIDSSLIKLPDGKYQIKAFLWHQGESDKGCGKNYYKNMKIMVEYVRQFLTDKTGDKKYQQLPFICGTVSRQNKQYNPEVEAALYKLAKEDKNFYVIDMSKAQLQKDQLHFTAESAEDLGIKMYNKLIDLSVAGKKAKKIKENL